MFKIKHVLQALLHREVLQHILKCFAELALQQPLLLHFLFLWKKNNKSTRRSYCCFMIKIYLGLNGQVHLQFVHKKVYIDQDLFLKNKI